MIFVCYQHFKQTFLTGSVSLRCCLLSYLYWRKLMSEGMTCLRQCRINRLFSHTLIHFLTSQIPDTFALITAFPRTMLSGFEVVTERLQQFDPVNTQTETAVGTLLVIPWPFSMTWLGPRLTSVWMATTFNFTYFNRFLSIYLDSFTQFSKVHVRFVSLQAKVSGFCWVFEGTVLTWCAMT